MAANMKGLAALLILVAAQMSTFLTVEGRSVTSDADPYIKSLSNDCSKKNCRIKNRSVWDDMEINDRVTEASHVIKLDGSAIEIGGKIEEARGGIEKTIKDAADRAKGNHKPTINHKWNHGTINVVVKKTITGLGKIELINPIIGKFLKNYGKNKFESLSNYSKNRRTNQGL